MNTLLHLLSLVPCTGTVANTYFKMLFTRDIHKRAHSFVEEAARAQYETSPGCMPQFPCGFIQVMGWSMWDVPRGRCASEMCMYVKFL